MGSTGVLICISYDSSAVRDQRVSTKALVKFGLGNSSGASAVGKGATPASDAAFTIQAELFYRLCDMSINLELIKYAHRS